eukprot:scpid90953/ scgid34845/ 
MSWCRCRVWSSADEASGPNASCSASLTVDSFCNSWLISMPTASQDPPNVGLPRLSSWCPVPSLLNAVSLLSISFSSRLASRRNASQLVAIQTGKISTSLSGRGITRMCHCKK